jgi:membrane protease subunit (stomatin/prohibitin family)
MFKIFDVIKYEGNNDTFIWKHPCEDFNCLTQLIVHENQEAVFYMNGQALDLFGPGRYTLKTQNIPLIGKVLNLATGGLSPFHCEVYFINKSEQMAIKWGTDSRVQFVEPTYNFPLSIGASGEMSLQAVDSRKLLVKLVGTEDDLSQPKLVSYFRSFLMTRVKTYISQIIKSESINIFEIDEKLAQFSDAIKNLLITDFADYGISLETFFVNRVMKPDGEPQYEKFKELHFRQYADIAEAKLRQQTEIIDAETEAQKTVIDSKAQAAKRAQEGYTYQQERGFDVAEKVAENEAVGEFTNMGVGFGTMAGVGGAVGVMVGGMMNEAMTTATNPQNQSAPQPQVQLTQKFCDNCGAKLNEGADFCEECGAKVINSNKTCAGCGYVFERDSKFCPKCGTKRG